MQQRPFGNRSGFTIPPISVGAMRLPRDVDDAVRLIRHAIDSGMRYIDTSRGYGESEWILGRALKDGYREKVLLSTKWSPWIVKIRPDDMPNADHERRRIEESMRRLDVDYLDFYQVWNIDSREHYEQAVAPGGMLDGILKAKEDGLIRHTGFTTHDDVDNLLDYIEEVGWCEVILFTYNIMNRRYAPAIAKAHERGIGTIIMNPMGGGRLAEASAVLGELATEVGVSSVPEMAVRYVLSNPHVDTMLCGMTKLADVDDTLAAASLGAFDDGQYQRIEEFLDKMEEEKSGFCTACKYCLPCPQGIDIPAVMNAVFESRNWGLEESAARMYRRITGKGAGGDACEKCGKCEDACTQDLPIMEMMAYAASHFAEELTAP